MAELTNEGPASDHSDCAWMVKVRVYDISTGDKQVSNTIIISQYRGACVSLIAESIDRVLHYNATRFTFLLTD